MSKRLWTFVFAAGLAAAVIGCPKNDSASANSNTDARKAADKPRVEQKYGFTSEGVGG